MLYDVVDVIEKIKHVEHGWMNYYLNIRCYQGYYHFNYIQNKDQRTELEGIYVSNRDLLEGLLEVESLLKEHNYL